MAFDLHLTGENSQELLTLLGALTMADMSGLVQALNNHTTVMMQKLEEIRVVIDDLRQQVGSGSPSQEELDAAMNQVSEATNAMSSFTP